MTTSPLDPAKLERLLSTKARSAALLLLYDNTMASGQAFRFLDLPAELRTRIYKETFAHLPRLAVKSRRMAYHEPEKLLHVCRQVRSEVNAEYYQYLKAKAARLEARGDKNDTKYKKQHDILKNPWLHPTAISFTDMISNLDALLVDTAQVRMAMARVHRLQARSCERSSKELTRRLEW